MSMKTSYSERDYSFGQAMLTLRTAIGLTQAGLARHLGISRRAVGDWEAGSSYPKVNHLRELITLGVEQQAFAAGQEVEEIRRLWAMAHQKVLLDQRWLSTLLDQRCSSDPHTWPLSSPVTTGLVPMEETVRSTSVQTRPASGPRVDWGNALSVPIFCGREEEQTLLFQWVVQERCRVVSILGMGGIGKSA
jgi:transcriptional regulator with XRE-family HTH domain